jgi:hypothetical protein
MSVDFHEKSAVFVCRRQPFALAWGGAGASGAQRLLGSRVWGGFLESLGVA